MEEILLTNDNVPGPKSNSVPLAPPPPPPPQLLESYIPSRSFPRRRGLGRWGRGGEGERVGVGGISKVWEIFC